MRIAYVHRTQAHGVEGVHIHGIADAFRRMGHEVVFVAPVSDAKAAPPKVAAPRSRPGLLRWLGQHLPEFAFELAEMAYNFVGARKLREERSRGNIDLIYERYAIFSTFAGRVASRWNVPLVLEVNYTSRMPLVRKRSRLFMPFAAWCDRRIFRRATVLAVVSSYLREHLVRDFGIDPRRIVLVPNAADPHKFHPAVAARSHICGRDLRGRKVVGFVGTFSPWHGVRFLVDTFVRVAQDFADVVLLLIGDGPERPRIEKQVAELGLGERVLLAGTVEPAHLPEHLAVFSVGVMPDSNEYGSPMKIFEYMAMGKAVIVPDYAPLLDVVESGRQGFVFRRRDPASFEQALRSVLASAELLERMGHGGRSAILERHNWDENARRTLEALPQAGPA
jgi:glycosyltransferase involved in cell wall biosynthesis